MRFDRGTSVPPVRCFIRNAQSSSGFSLVELIVIIAIIGALTTMSLSGFLDFRVKAQVARAASEIRGIEKDILAFSSDKSRYPNNLAELGTSVTVDPWGRAYEYRKTSAIIRTWSGDPVNTDFDLYSVGIDGQTADSIADPASDDDIIRANDGAFCNSGKKYPL